MLKYGLIGAAALTLIIMPAIAQDRGGQKAPVTRAELETRIKDRFVKIDTNRDGSVSPAEMRAHIQTRKSERRDKRFDTLDSNNDGAISHSEFDTAEPSKGRQGKRALRMAKAGRGMWQRADTNADGNITLAEAMARPMAMFDRSDTDKDGTLTLEERKAARETRRGE